MKLSKIRKKLNNNVQGSANRFFLSPGYVPSKYDFEPEDQVHCARCLMCEIMEESESPRDNEYCQEFDVAEEI